ncbi:MAG: hypothetical protein M1380_06780 [Chloroflexi bacterium]|nr:hypothetical protein [Chloroflexota bacterium]
MAHRAFSIVQFLLLPLLFLPPSTLFQQEPEFRLGFKGLADLIPQLVGSPLEEEQRNPLNGDALQRTTTGLMVWRKADNWTAFTDGSRSWIRGPQGLQSRGNEELFDWEVAAAVPGPTLVPPLTATPGPSATPALPLGGIRSPDPAGEWVTSVSPNTRYYTSRNGLSVWRDWTPRNRIWFATEGDLLSAYPGRARR